jgi:hypothetical protein
MLPPNSIFNSADGALPNSVFFGYYPLKPVVRSDGVYLHLSKFRGIAIFSAISGPMGNFIRNIGSMSIPSKVCQKVIQTVTIVVAALHSYRVRSYKSHQYKPMYQKGFGDIILPNRDAVFHFLSYVLFSDLAATHRPNTANIRNLIKTFISRYWPPSFHVCHTGINQTMDQA